MTPAEFSKAGIYIFGRKHWKLRLADALACDVSTIHRMMHREQIPGPYEIALKGMVEARKRQIKAEKEARMLLPARLRPKLRVAKRKVERTDDVADDKAD